MVIQTTHEGTLLKDLSGEINLFTGAGFSVLANNYEDKPLPIGEELANELNDFCKNHGSQSIIPNLNLSRIYSIANIQYKEELADFMTQKYKVKNFSNIYYNLNSLKIKNWFTTNIDNLPFKILDDTKYLNNIYNSGDSYSTDKRAINFFPFHGNVDEYQNNNRREYIFSEIDLASSVANDSGARRVFNSELLKRPTFFLGYSFNDLIAWKELNDIQNPQKNMWVLLRDDQFKESAISFFEGIGFHVIIGDINAFCEYLGHNFIPHQTSEIFSEEFKEYSFPILEKKDPFKDIKYFYQGSEPSLNQISKVVKLSIFHNLEDMVYKNKNVIVTGMIFSGKTTISKQLFKQLSSDGRNVYYFDKPLNSTELEFFLKKLDKVLKEDKLVFIIDNFCSNVEFVLGLLDRNNVQIIAFDRFYNYDSLRHRFSKKDVEYLEISEVENKDIYKIVNNIPTAIKKPKVSRNINNSKTIFDIIERSLKDAQKITSRVTKMLNIIRDNPNENLLDLLLLSAYFSKAKVPISMNVLIGFFDMSYQNIYKLVTTLQDQIIEDVIITNEDQDYFTLRSSIYASKIMDLADKDRLKKVIQRVAYNVPNEYIENYYMFKRSAYDSEMIFKIFKDVDEGLEFYREIYRKDKNPYTYQHAAMYAAKMKDYTEAFNFINDAINSTPNKIFSIQNVYATILFQANLEQDSSSSMVSMELDKSMNILESCINDAQGKVYHISTYSNQALKLNNLLSRDKDREYMEKALRYIEDTLITLDVNEAKNKRDLTYFKKQLESNLRINSKKTNNVQ